MNGGGEGSPQSRPFERSHTKGVCCTLEGRIVVICDRSELSRKHEHTLRYWTNPQRMRACRRELQDVGLAEAVVW